MSNETTQQKLDRALADLTAVEDTLLYIHGYLDACLHDHPGKKYSPPPEVGAQRMYKMLTNTLSALEHDPVAREAEK